mmetsp:Transcript_11991/g.24127  ORF Transcript_11991/g.24127 Transcript_11991/m.24127 type:complete len:300 (-) Transcript_11991:1891-2790(-)
MNASVRLKQYSSKKGVCLSQAGKGPSRSIQHHTRRNAYANTRKHLYHPDLERAKYMEDVYHILARKALLGAKELTQGSHDENRRMKIEKETCSRYMVGIVGMPGSGKSTLARNVAQIINSIQEDTCAVVLPMDGYHYTKAALDEFDDPGEAHARRGAPWTFDAQAFVDTVVMVADRCQSRVDKIWAPTFDHRHGDPVDKGVCIAPYHSIVLVEGNYLLLEQPPWNALRDVFHETWYIDCDMEESLRRVFHRQTRNGAPARAARHRIETNDRLNAMDIYETADAANVMIPSLPFSTRRRW